jgi:DNA-binding NtrC family response regulator
MRKQPGIEGKHSNPVNSATQVLTVLSVSPLEEDHSSLQSIADHSVWAVFKANNLISALALLQKQVVTVVLCEKNLMPGTYVDLLEHIIATPNAPSLIVASRLADERLWAEALNLGAWDVLAKPFDRSEVLRSVKSGWQHWHDQSQLQTGHTQQKIAATGT